jgi:hypothetical protein
LRLYTEKGHRRGTSTAIRQPTPSPSGVTAWHQHGCSISTASASSPIC